MLALEEKVRTLVLLKPDLVGESKVAEILAKFEESYLEVKARKQVYLTDADAKSFFHYLPSEEKGAEVEAVTKGLCEVVVLEHLDGDALDKTKALIESTLAPEYGAGNIYCSSGKWECMRDLEFFFPHLDNLQVERTLALIKPDGVSRGKQDKMTLEELVEAEVAAKGLFVVGKRKVMLKSPEAEVLCEELKGTADHSGTMNVLLSEPGVIAMCLEGPGAVGKWQLLCGPTNSLAARSSAPTTIRANWGTDGTSNAVHCSSSIEAADKELKALFPDTLMLQRTLCIVKPDAMPRLKEIRAEILKAGFTVLRDEQVTLTEDRAKEFYRDHKNQSYFSAMVKEASSGPCGVSVLCRLEAVTVLQQLMGPETVKDAKRLRPSSLRARFGRDGQRNAVHGSASAKAAAREARFFFPQLSPDPSPDDEEVRDFLFRKGAKASMDLKTLSDTDNTDYTVDPTMQQLLSKGLMALCQTKPKGLAAIKELSRWLMENNPNTSSAPDAGMPFDPPERTKRFIEYGVNPDGMTFAVEAPPPVQKKKVVEVDVSEEQEENRVSDLTTPPFVIFVAGGPGSGKGTQCTKLKEEFNLVHLSTGDLMREEVAAKTYLGTEIEKCMIQGTLVPDSVTLALLKKTMVKHQDTNRFLLDGFPRSVEQAKRFEQEIAEVAFVLYFEASDETMQERIAARAVAAPGRVDDNPETVAKRLKVFAEQTMPVVNYYGPIGKIRKANAEKSPDEVYAEARRYFNCRLLYLLGPPGSPVAPIAGHLEEKYGYSGIDLNGLLQAYAESDAPDAAKVKQALSKGKPVDASITCPLVLSEIYRDMALGVQNFVICDFPQSQQQAQFLEYRVPCNSKPLLLDFSRADGEDLAAPLMLGDHAVEVAMQTATFYSPEVQGAIAGLPNLTRVPISLAELDGIEAASGMSLDQQLVSTVWPKVCEKVMPGLTVVLGLPCSGTEVLANLLASLSPNTQTVDCNLLLDRELERRTETGITMNNMLARGQVVPLSTTLELLKDIINLSCSDSLVVENCPLYVDQVDYIQKEFRIDRVFYISGDSAACTAWKDAYVKSNKSEDPQRDMKAFDERMERLEPIITHFSRLGKLERIEVTETPSKEALAKMVETATMPKFAVVSGLSTVLTPQVATQLATDYGVGPALTKESVIEFAATKLKMTVDPADYAQFNAALKQYALAGSYPILVLDRYPKTAAEVTAFTEFFGEPAVVANIVCDDEFIETEYKEKDEEISDEELAEKIGKEKETADAMAKTLEEACPSCPPLVIDRTLVKTTEDMTGLVKKRLRPKVYIVVGPSGTADFSGLVAGAIANSKGSKTKMAVIDSSSLFRKGSRSAALEDRLAKASFAADSPDCVPASLWLELFTDAFAKSANPMGTFLITNFPTVGCLGSGITVRDQFGMLESISTLVGVLHVKLSPSAFSECCSSRPEDLEGYVSFDEKVYQQLLVQYGNSMMCDCMVDSASDPEGAAAKVATSFHSFRERAAEQAPKP